jgi:hypothetical protein
MDGGQFCDRFHIRAARDKPRIRPSVPAAFRRPYLSLVILNSRRAERGFKLNVAAAESFFTWTPRVLTERVAQRRAPSGAGGSPDALRQVRMAARPRAKPPSDTYRGTTVDDSAKCPHRCVETPAAPASRAVTGAPTALSTKERQINTDVSIWVARRSNFKGRGQPPMFSRDDRPCATAQYSNTLMKWPQRRSSSSED